MSALCAAAETSKYIGVFTKVVGFEEIEPSPPGTGRRYGWTAAIPVVVKRTDALVSFSNYLVMCTSSKSFIMTPYFALKAVISCTT